MIEWTERASSQLDNVHDYIALTNSVDVAAAIRLHIIETLQQLLPFPMSGRAGRVPGTRELVIPKTPFVAVYTVQKTRILVLAVYHGAQRWPGAL
ncbi:Addiction module toxin, RelE/StbE [Candidatus Koribacter versatilis Ellin345]|uniref:Addiction module toxin, RelE/StbE n=1 Tax=Koribacter versatilis (strain Ellin345) TaxID=204669 RepID=Q1ISM1_KORVE|nr:type II toxin-antitoxin system RelE/ParE family toxin [Candidatus Koribacter versatilis]ABF40129.1 Addiction module toxin, RelE/StbE [Candidatus Koribacter versatilis Ellin345]